MSSIGTIKVVNEDASVLCDDSLTNQQANYVVKFTNELGDVPIMTASTASLSHGAKVTITESVKGSKESEECSSQGICDATTGECACTSTHYTSDADGSPGTRNDCGAIKEARR